MILDLLSCSCRRVKLVFVNYEALISEIENILRKLITFNKLLNLLLGHLQWH